MKSKIKSSHAEYIRLTVSDMDKNSKRFWNYMKAHRSDKVSIECLNNNGVKITDPKLVAETLNNQFNSVFNSDCSAVPSNLDPLGPHPGMAMMGEFECSTYEVRKLHKEIDANKSKGPDRIAPRILKEGADLLAPSLTKLFNASLQKGIVPNDWRQAHVTPVFKNGQKDDSSNYTPMSPKSIVSKTLERIVCNRLVRHLNTNNILNENQHGFRAGRSCETQLLDAVHDWSSSLDNGNSVNVVFLDFAKAFDRVRHDLLYKKLNAYGIGHKNLKWIMNFLKNRTQRVVINGSCSSWSNVTSGVPQGTILGSVLFLCFINDIADSIHSTIRLYADDCTLYRPISTENDCAVLQADLNSLYAWSNRWKLSFNVRKCKVMNLSKKLQSEMIDYYIGDDKLPNTYSEKYLGVIINNKLNWSEQCHEVYSKCNRMMGLIKRNFRNCPENVLKRLYISLIRSRLDYRCIVWDPYRVSHSSILDNFQKRYVRFTCKDCHSNYNVLLSQLGWTNLVTS